MQPKAKAPARWTEVTDEIAIQRSPHPKRMGSEHRIWHGDMLIGDTDGRFVSITHPDYALDGTTETGALRIYVKS